MKLPPKTDLILYSNIQQHKAILSMLYHNRQMKELIPSANYKFCPFDHTSSLHTLSWYKIFFGQIYFLWYCKAAFDCGKWSRHHHHFAMQCINMIYWFFKKIKYVVNIYEVNLSLQNKFHLSCLLVWQGDNCIRNGP